MTDISPAALDAIERAPWSYASADITATIAALRAEIARLTGSVEPIACQTCKAWGRFKFPVTDSQGRHLSGVCRRKAPRDHTGWPTTRESDWCGEHVARAEAKP